ncbi:MAG: hypothetical protein ACN6O7_00215 [Sphingobacterium sp.]
MRLILTPVVKAVVIIVIFFTFTQHLMAQDKDINCVKHFLKAAASDTLTTSGLSALITPDKKEKLDSILLVVNSLKKTMDDFFMELKYSDIEKAITEEPKIEDYRIFGIQVVADKKLTFAVRNGYIYSLIYADLPDNSSYICF